MICTGNWDELFVSPKTVRRGSNKDSRDTFFRPQYKKVTEYNATANYDWRESLISPKKKKPMTQAYKTTKDARERIIPATEMSMIKKTRPQGKYEVSRSPERDSLIETLKARRD